MPWTEEVGDEGGVEGAGAEGDEVGFGDGGRRVSGEGTGGGGVRAMSSTGCVFCWR